MTSTTFSPPTSRQTWSVWLILPTVLAIAAVNLLLPYPPLQDFIEWIYQADVLTHPSFGTAPAGVQLAEYPVPNSLFQLLLSGLAWLVSAPVAGRIFLLAYILAAPVLAWTLARRYQPTAAGPFACILLISFCFNAPFWNGYANYQTGLLLFAAWFLLPSERQASPFVILAYSVLLFFAHAISFAAFAVILGVQALADRRPMRTALALAPAVMLFAWYVVKKAPPEQGEFIPVEHVPFLIHKAYTLIKIGPYHNFVFSSGGDGMVRPWAYWAGTAVNLLYTAGLLAVIGWGLWTSWRRRAMPLVPVTAAALLGLMFLMLPVRVVQSVVNPGERLMYPALLILLLFLPLPKRLVQILGAAMLVLPLCLLGLGFGQHDWKNSVPPLGPTPILPASRVMFWHRPTAFVCKWQEIERRQAEGDAPRLPITFRTSLLVGQGGEECAPDWAKRLAR